MSVFEFVKGCYPGGSTVVLGDEFQNARLYYPYHEFSGRVSGASDRLMQAVKVLMPNG